MDCTFPDSSTFPDSAQYINLLRIGVFSKKNLKKTLFSKKIGTILTSEFHSNFKK